MLLQRGQLAHTVYLGSPVWFTSTTSDPLDGVCCVHLCSSGLSTDWPPGHNISKRTTPTKTAAARPSAHSCPSTDAPAAKHHCMLHVNLQQPAADAALPHNSTATVSGCKDGRPMSVGQVGWCRCCWWGIRRAHECCKQKCDVPPCKVASLHKQAKLEKC